MCIFCLEVGKISTCYYTVLSGGESYFIFSSNIIFFLKGLFHLKLNPYPEEPQAGHGWCSFPSLPPLQKQELFFLSLPILFWPQKQLPLSYLLSCTHTGKACFLQILLHLIHGISCTNKSWKLFVFTNPMLKLSYTFSSILEATWPIPSHS